MIRYLVTWTGHLDGSAAGYRQQVVPKLAAARTFADSLRTQGFRTRIWQLLPQESSPAELAQRAIDDQCPGATDS